MFIGFQLISSVSVSWQHPQRQGMSSTWLTDYYKKGSFSSIGWPLYAPKVVKDPFSSIGWLFYTPKIILLSSEQSPCTHSIVFHHLEGIFLELIWHSELDWRRPKTFGAFTRAWPHMLLHLLIVYGTGFLQPTTIWFVTSHWIMPRPICTLFILCTPGSTILPMPSVQNRAFQVKPPIVTINIRTSMSAFGLEPLGQKRCIDNNMHEQGPIYEEDRQHCLVWWRLVAKMLFLPTGTANLLKTAIMIEGLE